MEPADPIAAVTHADPYPYYAELVERGELRRDETLGVLVAADAATVQAVLTSDSLGVRPADEKVPAAFAGSRAGDLFGAFMRFDDSPKHEALRDALDATLPTAAPTIVKTVAQAIARDCITNASAPTHGDVAFRLPLATVGALLGLATDDLGDVVASTQRFVRGIAAGDDVPTTSAAADSLLGLLAAQLEARLPRGALLPLFTKNVEATGGRRRDAVANAAGLFFQTCDATAGLIGNALVRLRADDQLLTRSAREFSAIPKLLAEIVRWDPPVQNTRRFAHRATTIAGVDVAPGETILVLLAAANRDPRANERPADFDLDRTTRRSFTFGAGLHACPGERFASAIAEAALRALVDRERLPWFDRPFVYLSSVNTRVPLFPG